MHVINCREDGTIETLWTDSIPLADLGPMTITRASTIEFNHAEQEWEVLIDGKVMFSDPSRETCLVMEHAHFNNQFLTK